jgi:hypothetical protein
MRKLLFVAAAATSLVAAAPAFAAKDYTASKGGIDVGPLGQCFDPRDCGPGRGAKTVALGHECSMARERVVTKDGRVMFKRHRVCN